MASNDLGIETGAGRDRQQDLSFEEKSRGMHYGLYAAVLGITYFFATGGNILTLFAKRLGASNTQIGGILSLLLVFSVVQIFVAGLIERHGKKPFMIGGWVVASTLSLAYLAIPMIYQRYGSQAAVYSLMGMIVPIAVARQVAAPGWMPLLNDVVPSHVRGRYFAKMRTWWQGASIVFLTATSIFFSGHEDAPFWRYQVVFLVGIAASWVRIGAIKRMPELPPSPDEQRRNLWRTFGFPFADPVFVRYITFTALVTAALSLTDSYMVVYLKSGALSYNDSMALFVSTVIFFSGSAVSLLIWGWLADRLGSKPLLIITVIGMGAVRFLWLGALAEPGGRFVIAAIYLLNGMFSAGFGIASTRYLFGISPRSFGKTTYITLAAVVNTLVAAGMVQLGGYMIDGLSGFSAGLAAWGLDEYRLPFVASGAMILASSLILARLREQKTVPTGQVLGALFSRPFRTGYNVFLWGRALPEERRVDVTRRLGEFASVIGEEEILSALDDPSFQVRREAAQALVRLKSRRAVRALIGKLEDPYSFVRASAAVALGGIGSPAACGALEKALEDENAELRMQAALALGKIGRGGSAEAVRAAMGNEDDQVVWSVMATARGMLGDESVAGEVVRRLNRDTPQALRGQLLIAASYAIGAGNDLYHYLHRGEEEFEGSVKEIVDKVLNALRSLPTVRDLQDLWSFLALERCVDEGDYKRVVRSAYEFALLLYGKDIYPAESAAGAALEAIATKHGGLRWDSALLALECVEVMIRNYPRWFDDAHGH